MYEGETCDRGPGVSNPEALEAFFITRILHRILCTAAFDSKAKISLFKDDDYDDIFAVVWDLKDDDAVYIHRASESDYRKRYDEYDWDGDPDCYIETLEINPQMGKILIPFMSEKFSALEQLGLSGSSIEEIVSEHSIWRSGLK